VTKDLDATTVVLTGASSGIGAVVARSLAARGATVVHDGHTRRQAHDIGLAAALWERTLAMC
jgi:retinol dehydrogenase-12